MPGILVIRGGAIGDFVLTLPAIALLRETFPETRLEILGYRHIVALAEGRFYAQATRSIEYAGLASFFIPGGKLREEMVDYFSGFDQVVSYLFDPDAFFEENLRRAGVRNLISAGGRINVAPGAPHASRQLAAPLQSLALYMEEGEGAEAARLYPNAEDGAIIASLQKERPLVAVHPGSGSAHKCWPLDQWERFLCALEKGYPTREILLVGGEADYEKIEALRARGGWRAALDLPLPHLAALLQRAEAFVGHDSGVSHIAAAVRTPSILIYGPTDPKIWAPRSQPECEKGMGVQVLRASNGDLSEILPETLLAQLSKILIVP